MNTSKQDNNLQPTTDNVELTKSSNYYDELLEYLKKNQLTINAPDLPKDFNPNFISNNKYTFALSEEITDPEYIKKIIDKLLNSNKNIAYDFIYYSCSWSVIYINEYGYHAFDIRILKQSNPDVRYYISIQLVEPKRYSDYFKDFCAFVESSFDKTIDTSNFEVLPIFALESEENDVKAIVEKAFKDLEHPEPTNKSLHPYWINEFVIKQLANVSANSDAKKCFTSDRLSMVLKFWESIEKYEDLILTSTRCAIIIYNILLTESILDDVTPLIDYCLKIAKEEGYLWDEHLRLNACQIIKIIIDRNYNITDEKRNEITYFFDGLVEKNHKFVVKLSL
jgi:hypothetical protein